MKKGIRCLLLAFMMLFMFCVSVAAAEQTEAQLYYVTDAAGLLDENENMKLEKCLPKIRCWCLHCDVGGLSGRLSQ